MVSDARKTKAQLIDELAQLRRKIEALEQRDASTFPPPVQGDLKSEENEFHRMARRIFENCRKLTGAQSGYVALLSDDGHENKVLFLESGGRPCSVDESLPMPVRGLRAEAYKTRQPVYDNDFKNSHWITFMPAGHVPLDNVLFAPMNIQGKAMGLIGLANKPGDFSDDDAAVAGALGEMCAIAFETYIAKVSLKESQLDLAMAQKIAHIGSWQYDADSRRIDWSDELYRICGLDPASGPPGVRQGLGMIHPEDRPRTEAAFEKAVKDGASYTVEYRIIRPDGEERFIQGFGEVETDENGVVRRVYGTGQDITERRRAETALYKSEAFRKAITDSVLDAIFCKDTDFRYTFLNPAMENLLGRNASEIIGKTAREVFGDKAAPIIAEVDEMTLKDRSADVVRGLVINGRQFYFHTVQVPLYDDNGQSIGLCGIVRDITDRKKERQALEESEEKYRRLSLHIPGMIYQAGKDWQPEFIINPEEISGYTVKDFELGRINWLDLIHPEDKEKIFENGTDLLDKPKSIIQEYRIFARDGALRWVSDHKTTYIENDRIIVYGVVYDITERKRVEAALRESEDRYFAMFNYMTSGVAVYEAIDNGKDFIFVNFNKAAEEITRIKKTDALGKSLLTIFPNMDRAGLLGALRRVYRTGVSEHLPPFYYQDAVRAGWRENFVYKLPSGEVVAIFDDVTERKQAEEELQKFHKLESIGILAGGIAHDFNNILTSLWGNIQLASMNTSRGDKNFEFLEGAERSCLRAQDLTRQLLTFAKGGAPIKEKTSLVDVITDTTTFVLRGSKIKPEYTIPDGLPLADVDKNQISQVLENIAINADQAMPDGGIVKIRAEVVRHDANTQDGALPLAPGEYIEITVKDHGIGISQDNIAKIFDPYWTTKPKGSGLGLSTCYSIINKHGGHIRVESQLEKGACFYIYLPVSENQTVEQQDRDETEIETGQGKVLVMDDEANVRQITRIMLKRLGYEVDVAADGEAAIALYGAAMAAQQPYDAVLLDLTVPGGLGGVETIKKLLKMDPQVKAAVCSGYFKESVIAEYEEHGFQGVVSKPIDMKSLGLELKRLIG